MSSATQKPSAVDPASYLIGAEGKPGAALLAASVRDVLLRIGDVCAVTGLSVPTIYRLMSRDQFPRPLKITRTARAWKLSEVTAWVDSRERHQAAQPGDGPRVNPHPDTDQTRSTTNAGNRQ
jgi:prophage regulatory protein